MYRQRVTLFFFQAEDGIRGLTVTGVQTCALPISGGGGDGEPCGPRRGRRGRGLRGCGSIGPLGSTLEPPSSSEESVSASVEFIASSRRRSEERRVGKACRVWWVAAAS